MPAKPNKTLETFPNPQPDREYIIDVETPEFTCLCPKTGQPDFATLQLEYVPDRLCVELKSLKLYIWSYRDEGAFHEKVTNTILNDLVAATRPRYMRLRARFNVRGGIYTSIEAEYRAPGWTPAPPPPHHLPREAHTGAPEAPVVPRPAAVGTPIAMPPEPTPPKAKKPAPKKASPVTPDPAGRSQRFRMLARTRAVDDDTLADTSATTDVTPPPKHARPAPPVDLVYIGLDLGTSGCRAFAIDIHGTILADATAPLPAPVARGEQVTQDPALWWESVGHCLGQLLSRVDAARVTALAVAATSGTLVLCDATGRPLSPGIMYNDRRAQSQAKRIAAVAPAACGAHGASGALAKLLWLQEAGLPKGAAHVLNQADWVANRLTGKFGHSDYNNCLKLGGNADTLMWPDWLATLAVEIELLPQIHAPGDALGTVTAEVAKTFGLPASTQVMAGTSDGVAAFIASGAHAPGHGVTSLGSTLVLKLLADKPVFSPTHGVYSHRLGNYWLAGGASNSGGAVLLQYFDVEQLHAMTPLLDPDQFTDLDYYPLPDVGERFPTNDPQMVPRLEPLPGDSAIFFQGMLEGMARIEARGYQLLAELGAPALTAVWTTGGGSANLAWQRIRERLLRVAMHVPRSREAAFGAALIAAGVVAKEYQ